MLRKIKVTTVSNSTFDDQTRIGSKKLVTNNINSIFNINTINYGVKKFIFTDIEATFYNIGLQKRKLINASLR